MRRLTHFCLRFGLLPGNRWLRRRMLRSVFRPAKNPAYGIDGWYDLGQDVSANDADRFKEWAERE